MKNRKDTKNISFLRKKDIIIAACIIAASLAVWLIYGQMVNNKPAKALIYFESELIKTIPLEKGHEEDIILQSHENVTFHLYEDGSVAFKTSSCPDQVCVRSGRLKTIGQSTACLPNGLILKIVPMEEGKKDDVDLIG